MNLLEKIHRHGLLGSAQKGLALAKRKSGWSAWRMREVPKYHSPTIVELESIECELRNLGVTIYDYCPSIEAYNAFKQDRWFPNDYHGGVHGGVWDEKILEHFISYDLLKLQSYKDGEQYIDIAAGDSPWAMEIRKRLNIDAYAIDLNISPTYRNVEYYKKEDATKTSFPTSSVKGLSLQCAFEMFMGNDDIDLIKEASRILLSGGKLLVVPLYMHPEYCSYSTPDFWGKGYADKDAKEYVRMDCLGVPSSRKYDAQHLKKRVLDVIEEANMSYKLHVLRDKKSLGENIYCHFILEIIK